MPPKRRSVKGRVKVANTSARFTSTAEDNADHDIVAEPSQPAHECAINRVLSLDHSDASAEQSEGHLSEEDRQTQKAKKKKLKTYTRLNLDQEEEMVDWLKAHDVLYNKKLVDYKDTKKKAFLWQKQAGSMGVDVDELNIWYTSLRTRFTKLKKKKSGDGAPDHRERDQWVLDKFSFLSSFTYEVKKRTLVSLKSKLLPSSPTTADPIDEDDFIPPDGQMTSEGCDSQQQLTIPTTTASTTSSRSSTPKPIQSFTSAISSNMDKFMEMQNRIMQHMIRPNTDRMKEAFIEYIRESMYDMHPTLWEDMHRDIMKTVLVYKDKDSELKMAHTLASTAIVTAAAQPCQSSSAWQPSPHMWPLTVQNPVSVWGSMEPTWVQQQVPQHQHFPQHQQPHQFLQPQQQQQDIHQPSNSQLTTLASTPLIVQGVDTSFSAGLSSTLEGGQQQYQHQEVDQDEPQQSQD